MDDKQKEEITISNFNTENFEENEEEKIDININSYLKIEQKAYEVWQYQENCEEENQISYILPLAKSCKKFIIFIIFNILTLGIINIFLEWFPKLNLYIYYSVSDLNSASNFGIFSKNNDAFEIVEKNLIDLPQIDYNSENSTIKKFNLNIEPNTNKLILFEYRYFKYFYLSLKDNFEALSYYIKTTQKNILENFSKGLTSNEVLFMQKIFGKCDIEIEIDSWGKILIDELLDPYYLFLLYSLIIWFCLRSYIYSPIIIGLEAICFFLSVREQYINLKKLKELSRYSLPVNVYRRIEDDDTIEKSLINSTELVPGDVFEIPENNSEMPCDAILKSNDIIVDNSKLTGDFHPVIKEPLEPIEELFNTNRQGSENNILFSGTKILYIRKKGNSKTKGIVFRTGFYTVKGDLMSGVLNSDEEDENFKNDSIKYIIIMCIFTVVSYLITLKFLIVDCDYNTHDLIFFFLGPYNKWSKSLSSDLS